MATSHHLSHVKTSSGHLSITIDITTQQMIVADESGTIYSFDVSTGRPGHATPTGTFTILGKAVKHRSNIYSNAPMPYMQRLTNGGVALHAGHVPGYPASHGCIRLPLAFARQLYAMTDWKTRVIITREAPGSAEAAASLTGWRTTIRQADAGATAIPAIAYAAASTVPAAMPALGGSGRTGTD